MTNEDLIKKLQELPPEADVGCYWDGCHNEILDVRLCEPNLITIDCQQYGPDWKDD